MTAVEQNSWHHKRLKYVVQLCHARIEGSNSEQSYIGLEHIESGTGRLVRGISDFTEGTDKDTTANGESLCNTFVAGDVLFGKLRPYLAKAWVAEFTGRCTTELLVMRPTELISRFLRYVCLSRDFIDTVDASTFGSKMPRADWNFIGNMQVPLPSIKQQSAIADFLDRETAKIDALIAAKERLLEILAEKHLALISHAVTRGLNPGVLFRDSGIPWLGQIPVHWETERARWLFKERDERSETGEEELLTVSHLTGVTPRSEKNVNMFEAETTEGYKLCYTGDLVINTLWAWMGAMGVAPLDGIASPAYNVYTPNKRLDPPYIDELVRIPVFAEEATRFSKGVWSSRLRLYPEGFFEIWMPVPPLEEQHAIVAHIKQETAKIDTMRKAIEKTLALSKERRAALIAAAVTGQIAV